MKRQRPIDDLDRRRREVLDGGDPQQKWRPGVFRGSSVPSTHAGSWEQRHWTSRLLSRLSEVVAHSSAGAVAALLVSAWVVVGVASRFPRWWETVLYSATGSVTFVMVFVIQHTQQRQTAATQRKLDELLRSSYGSDKSVIAIEEAADEELASRASLNIADREAATNN